MNICIDTDGPMAQMLLDDNQGLAQYYMLNYTPLIFINGHLYKGNFEDTLHLVESLCLAFEDPPKECSDLEIFADYSNFSGSSLASFLGKVLFCSVAFFLVVVVGFYLYYKRKMKKKMNNELSDKINSAIMKYYGSNQTDSRYQGISKHSHKEFTEHERKIAVENSITSTNKS